MFTGIVEEMGTIRAVRRGRSSSVLSIGASMVLSDLKIGDSVAVNGVCLTATGKDDGGFTADVMHETLDRSSLGSLTVATVDANGFSISAIPHTVAVTILSEKRVGDTVNLETDIIGKYVEKLLRPQPETTPQSGITREFLAENGF